MVQLAEAFPDWEIVVPLIRQLTWTHFIALLLLRDPLQREFLSEQRVWVHLFVMVLGYSRQIFARGNPERFPIRLRFKES